MKLALDTNILAYAEGVNGQAMKDRALALLDGLPADAGMVPVQALGELFIVLVRKAARSRQQARLAILSWQDAYGVIPTSPSVLLRAADLSADHQFGIWDAVMMAAAAEAGCRLLLSQDMQDGFVWGGVTIANPFAEPRSSFLARALQRS